MCCNTLSLKCIGPENVAQGDRCNAGGTSGAGCATFPGSSQPCQESQERIVSPKALESFRFWRRQGSQRPRLHRKVSLNVLVRCLDTLVTEPESDQRNIHTRL